MKNIKNIILILVVALFTTACDWQKDETSNKVLISSCSSGTTLANTGDTIENPNNASIVVTLGSTDEKNVCIDSGDGAYLVRR